MHPLTQLRTALGLKQAAFAQQLGVTQPYVSQVESGHESMGARTALRCADLWRKKMIEIGITVEDLVRGTRNNPEEPAA